MDAKVPVLLTLLLASLHSEVGGQTTTPSPAITIIPSPTTTPSPTDDTDNSSVGSGNGSTPIQPFSTSEVSTTPTPSPSVTPTTTLPTTTPPTTAPPTTVPPTTVPPTTVPPTTVPPTTVPPTTAPPATTPPATTTTTSDSEISPTGLTSPSTSVTPTQSLVGPVLGGIAGAIVLILIVLIAIMIIVICRPRWRKMAYMDERSHRMVGSTDPLLVNTIALEDTLNGKMVGSQMFRKAVPIEEFPLHVKQLHANVDQGMEDQFRSIGTLPLSSHNASKLPHNIPKNRFENVFPYDASRVKLVEIAGVPGSDYINASFLDGYNKLNGYIASQGPLEETINDFWRMVWEFKLPTIVMLTETVEAGREKCAQYWPKKDNEPWTVGYNLTVTLTEHRQFAEYKVKNFTVKNTKAETVDPLKVTHFHYSAWPDHGVPADKTSLIQFIQRVRKSHKYDGPPLLVHCSAGVGRTGTFMTLDSMLQRMMAKEETLDVYEFICHLRVKRPLMVQTEIQYAFIHDALEEFITCGDTAIAVTNLWITINKLKNVSEGKSGFSKQFELLGEVSHMPTEVNCNEALEEFNTSKNRYPPVDHLPYNITRVRLRPTGVKGADYINASFVDGYKHRRAYIVTQGPLESTVNDFWRMISEHKCRTIVMLCNLEEDGKECCFPYWPKEKDTTMTYGKLKVQLLSEQDCGDFVIRKLEMGEADSHYQVPGVPDGIVITQFHHTKWAEKGEPPVTSSILRLIDALIKTQISTGNQAITVMCNDGIGRSGTFTCIYSQLERIKVEAITDVFQYIKASRLQRPGLVSELEQFVFCHYVLADYIDSFDTYANFKDWS